MSTCGNEPPSDGSCQPVQEDSDELTVSENAIIPNRLCAPAPADMALTPGRLWWDEEWRFRLPVIVHAGAFARIDRPVELDLDLDAEIRRSLPQGVDEGIQADSRSIRVVRVDNGGLNLGVVESQFDVAPVGRRASKGTVVWTLPHSVSPSATCYYFLYFNTAGSPPRPVTPNGLRVSMSGTDADYWRVSAPPYGEYVFQRSAGNFCAFSPTNVGGESQTDWIRGDQSARRGIPLISSKRLDPIFQAGTVARSTTEGRVSSKLLQSGPVKITIESNWLIAGPRPSAWRVLYDIFPSTIRVTLLSGAKAGFVFAHAPTTPATARAFVSSSEYAGTRPLQRGGMVLPVPDGWSYQEFEGSTGKLYLTQPRPATAAQPIPQFRSPNQWVVASGWKQGAMHDGMNQYPAVFFQGFVQDGRTDGVSHEKVLTFIDSIRQPLEVLVGPAERRASG